nr:hypothetical protein GCM10020093_105540 [Planobispora longispora]
MSGDTPDISGNGRLERPEASRSMAGDTAGTAGGGRPDAAGDELTRLDLRNDQGVFAMRKLGREVAETVGLTGPDQIRVATALSEIGREILLQGIPASAAFLIDEAGLTVTISFPAAAASSPATG